MSGACLTYAWCSPDHNIEQCAIPSDENREFDIATLDGLH